MARFKKNNQDIGVTPGASLDMEGNQINNLGDPSNPTDAITVTYAQTLISTSHDNTKLNLSGGVMTGILNMGGSYTVSDLVDPIADQSAATKFYVDSRHDATKLSLSGGTMTGPIGMGSNTITDVIDPTNDQEVATKKYVDDSTGSGLSISGGTMEGIIDMNSNAITNLPNPTNPQDPITINWLSSNHDTTKLSLSGGTMSGTLDMGNNLLDNVGGFYGSDGGFQIINLYQALGYDNGGGQEIDFQTTKLKGVVDPTDAQDGATKHYIDTALGNLDLSTLPGAIDLSTQVTGLLSLSNNLGIDGPLNMFNYKVTNVSDPSGDGDAVPLLWAQNKFLATDVDSSMNNHRILDVTDPINPQDATTLASLTNKVFGGIASLSSGTVTITDSRISSSTVIVVTEITNSPLLEQFGIVAGSGSAAIYSTSGLSSSQVNWIAVNS